MHHSLTFSFYIARKFLLTTLAVILIIAAIIMLFDMIELIRRAASKDISINILLQIAFYQHLDRLEKVIPFIIMISGITTFIRLNHNYELVAARAAGISVWQFVIPAIFAAFLIGVFFISILNPLSAAITQKAENLEDEYFGGKVNVSISDSGLWLKQKNLEKEGKILIHGQRARYDLTEIYDINIFIYGKDNQYQSRIDAKSMSLKGEYWHIRDAILNVENEYPEKLELLKIKTSLSIDEIKNRFAQPEMISIWELPSFIKGVKEAGFSAYNYDLRFYQIIILPFFLSAMVILAALFSLTSPRQGKAGLMTVSAIAVSFVIYFISNFVSAISLSGSIPTYAAASFSNYYYYISCKFYYLTLGGWVGYLCGRR